MFVYVLFHGYHSCYYDSFGCPEESENESNMIGIYSTEEKAKKALLEEIDSDYIVADDGFSASYNADSEYAEYGKWYYIRVVPMDNKLIH